MARPSTPKPAQRPRPALLRVSPPLSAQQLCDGMRTLPIVLSFFSLFFFDSETVKEAQARCPPCHSPQVSVHRASLLSPAAEQAARVPRTGRGTVASIRKQSWARISRDAAPRGETCLPAGPDRWNLERFVRPQRNASMRPTPESVLALARPPKLKPGDTEWSTLNNGVFFHIQPASVPYRILSKAVN